MTDGLDHQILNLLIRRQLILIYWLTCISGMVGHGQPPVADFSANPVSGCGPLGVSFKDLSTGSPLYWTWDFGNGQISSQQNPSTTYVTPGVYTVTLIVRNSSGANSIRKTNYIRVFPYPSPSFTSSLPGGVGCAPTNIQFTDLSTPGAGQISSWNWTFGDGSTSTQQNPSHIYSQTGYYTVGLTVTNSAGCSNGTGVSRYLRVIPGVQAKFTWNQVSTSCSPPFQLNFINQTAGPGNMSYSWDLGNGSTSTDANPTTVYPTNLSYTVKLHAVSDLGCSKDTQTVISLAISAPSTKGPDSACINSPVTFTNGSSPQPVSVAWDFGDGTQSPLSSPSKKYTSPGTYTVKMVNTYTACKDSTTRPIVVINTPAPSFKADRTIGCQAPFTVNFTDLSAGATSWLWNFGDGQTSTAQIPAHTYTTTGTFDVTLTITNPLGCSGSVTMQKFIQISPPTATLGGLPLMACTGASVTPISIVNAIDGVAAYSWSAPGATPASSTSPTPAFQYTAPGNYDISLTITTKGGCTQTFNFPSAVIVGAPSAPGFTVLPTPPDVCGKRVFTFTSTASPADSWSWDFGDGSKGGDSAVIHHAYTDTGKFTVQLTVVNHGCSKTGNATVVHVKPPFAKFIYAADCMDKHKVSFTDSSIIDPSLGATYVWNFGDGSPPVTITPTPPLPPYPGSSSHTYTAFLPDSFLVTLTVTNGGCTDRIARMVTLASPVASFTAPAQACSGQAFVLSSTSTLPSQIASYTWTIGGTSFTTTVPGLSYAIAAKGTYPISLKITGVDGCSSSTLPGPSIAITGPGARFNMPAGGCLNGPITFTDQTTPYPATAPIVTWTWNFGDGPDQSLPGPGPGFIHKYSDTGSYTVRLRVTDSYGCSDTWQSPAKMQITAPQAGFYAKDTFYCPNAPLPFTDTSKGYNLSYAWDFGDTTGSTNANPSHPFLVSGKHYSVRLKVTDSYGCADSLTRTNYIFIQLPIPAFTMQDSAGICVPMQTIFIPNARYYDSLYWNFGDGTTSTLDTTSHFFNTYDTFRVRLVLRGHGGCLDSATQRVLALNPNTTTSFAYSPLKACDSLLVNFKIIPPGYTRFTLYFGDGKADSSEHGNLSHLYKSPSAYSPSLLLQDSSGCIVTMGGPPGAITILGAVPFFNMNKKTFCDSGTVNFTDFTITNDPPVTETWLFGDGSSSNQPNPGHTYTTPGKLLPALKVVTNSNCTETYTDTVHVFQTPHPVITITSPYCVNSAIPFQGSLVTPDVDSVRWAWSFGDGRTSSLQNLTLTYANPGNYPVSLRTSVSFGCSDTTGKVLTVNPLPVIKGPAEITTPVGIPVTIPFSYSSNCTTWTWKPETNLSCADCPNPVATLTFSAEYVVTVTYSNNCTSTGRILVKTICNDKNYFAPNTFSPNGDGVNDVFYPRGSNLYNIQSMRIFNRWGQLVFERRNFPANSQADGWDGTFNGRIAPADVYVYIIEVICNNAQVIALKGNVALVR